MYIVKYSSFLIKLISQEHKLDFFSLKIIQVFQVGLIKLLSQENKLELFFQVEFLNLGPVFWRFTNRIFLFGGPKLIKIYSS